MNKKADILKRFRSGAYSRLENLDFTLDELTSMQGSVKSEDEFDLIRLRAWYHFLRGETRAALATQIDAYTVKPTLEGLKNIGIIARGLRDREHAIDFLLKREESFLNEFQIYDVLAHNCGTFGDIAAARRFGTRSLELKNARFGSTEKTMLPKIPPFRPEARRNVIAFSLFGTEDRYVQPLLLSADLRMHLYPLWTLRIYVDKTVPNNLINEFRLKGCEIVPVVDTEIPGTFWRFLVCDDENIDRYLLRDADSIFNIRERVAVDEWILSNKHFHVMRDFHSHSELMLAGLWGGVRGALPSMRTLIIHWLKEQKAGVYNRTTIDQMFLRERIWRIIQHSLLVHDSVFDFGEKKDFPSVGTLPRSKHVGQNDFIFFKKSTA